MDLSDLRIMVGLPCYGGVLYDSFLQSWTHLLSWAGRYDVHFTLKLITNESLLPRARNQLVASALDQGDWFTHILFVDADMGFSPEQFQRMAEWNKDVVGCPGPTKYIHWDKTADSLLHGRDPEVDTLRYAVNFFHLGDLDCTNGFALVKDYGLCFCLVRTAALRQMIAAYPEQKMTEMGWSSGKPFVSDNCYMLFDTYRDQDEDRYLECDHAFLARWRKLGGEVWADMTSSLEHVGTHHFKGNMATYFMGKPWDDGRFVATRTPWGRFPGQTDPLPGQTDPQTDPQTEPQQRPANSPPAEISQQ